MSFFKTIQEILFGRQPSEPPEPQIEIIKQPTLESKKRDETGYYPIVCPHCLNTFKIWEAEFRAYAEDQQQGAQVESSDSWENSGLFGSRGTSGSTAGNMGMAEMAFPPEEDEKFDAFEMKVNGVRRGIQGKVLQFFNEDGSPTGEVASVTLMDPKTGVSAETIKLDGINKYDSRIFEKPIFSIQDKYARNFTRRLCPHCHHAVSDLVGIVPSYTIGLVGSTDCGKTVYLTTVCGQMSGGVLHGDMLTALEAAADMDWTIRLRKMREKAEKGGAMSKGTSIVFMPPNILNCTRQKSYSGNGEGDGSFILNLFDFPGEALNPERDVSGFISQYTPNIPRFDGWMFLVDSASFNTFYNALETSEEKMEYVSTAAQAFTPLEVLSTFKARYLKFFNTPVAFVVTKSDLIVEAWNELHDVNPMVFSANTPDFLTTDTFVGSALDMSNVPLDEYSREDSVVRDFLSGTNCDANDFGFVQNAKGSVQDQRLAFFAVSSTGVPIVNGERPERGQGALRVTDPLLWLLWMLGAVTGEGRSISQEWLQE